MFSVAYWYKLMLGTYWKINTDNMQTNTIAPQQFNIYSVRYSSICSTHGSGHLGIDSPCLRSSTGRMTSYKGYSLSLCWDDGGVERCLTHWCRYCGCSFGLGSDDCKGHMIQIIFIFVKLSSGLVILDHFVYSCFIIYFFPLTCTIFQLYHVLLLPCSQL